MKKGRPTDYDPEYHPEKAGGLALLGCTDEEIAKFLDINPDTLYEWKKRHPEFSEAIKDGKENADIRVVQSLYTKAIGYEHKVTKDGEENMIYYPPDTTAAIFWLKNRQPAKWRDKQDIQIETKHLPDWLTKNQDEV